MLGQVLFNTFINDKDTKCIPSKCVEGTELSGVVYIPEQQDAIQRDQEKLKNGNFKRFN